MATRVTVWNEGRHEKKNPLVSEIYPKGMHEAIASHLRKSSGLEVGEYVGRNPPQSSQ